MSTYMFLKQERPETDDLEGKKNFFCKGKIILKMSIFKKNIGKFLTYTLTKISQNILARG